MYRYLAVIEKSRQTDRQTFFLTLLYSSHVFSSISPSNSKALLDGYMRCILNLHFLFLVVEQIMLLLFDLRDMWTLERR